MIVQDLQTNSIPVYNVPENNLKNSPISSKTLSENDIIKLEEHSFIKIPNNRLEEIKFLLESEFKIMDIMNRTETEKEISRVDGNISKVECDLKEIKTDIKEIRTDLKEIRRDYVTKDYLNNEFKNSLINEIKVMNQADKKEFIKWLIGTSLTVVAIIITALKYFI